MCIERQAVARRSSGLTFIELIVFMVIVSVALAGTLSVFNIVVRHSADPMVRKNLLSIAEALLEEVQSYPYCDAADTNCSIGVSGGLCTANRWQFGQVGDYAGCELPARIRDVSGSGSYLAPDGYSAKIGVAAPEDVNGAAMARISVTVSYGNDSLTLEGYRARYWPNQDAPW